MSYTEHISGSVVPVPYTYTGMTVVWACSETDFRIRRFAYTELNGGVSLVYVTYWQRSRKIECACFFGDWYETVASMHRFLLLSLERQSIRLTESIRCPITNWTEIAVRVSGALRLRKCPGGRNLKTNDRTDCSSCGVTAV